MEAVLPVWRARCSADLHRRGATAADTVVDMVGLVVLVVSSRRSWHPTCSPLAASQRHSHRRTTTGAAPAAMAPAVTALAVTAPEGVLPARSWVVSLDCLVAASHTAR